MIVGISGKMQSGKDTVALMWQYVADSNAHGFDISIGVYCDYIMHNNNEQSTWQVKYWAGKLRTFISDITGISVDDLMKDSVKNKVLPQWNKTPRELLQKIGTNVCRVVDEDFHIIALMQEYKPNGTGLNKECPHKSIYDVTEEDELKYGYLNYPNWIIPDTRFYNEHGCIVDHGGVVIRVERSWSIRYPELFKEYNDIHSQACTFDNFLESFYPKHTHPSETELDTATFTHTIYNNGTLEELLDEVETIYNTIYG